MTGMQSTSALPVFNISHRQDYPGKGIIRMMSLECREVGIHNSLVLTGTTEQEIMRKFITFAEDELKMPVLSCDTIYRIQMAIRK
jgi:predicted small metal-binding protein